VSYPELVGWREGIASRASSPSAPAHIGDGIFYTRATGPQWRYAVESQAAAETFRKAGYARFWAASNDHAYTYSMKSSKAQLLEPQEWNITGMP
jgi:hypothetical protein